MNENVWFEMFVWNYALNTYWQVELVAPIYPKLSLSLIRNYAGECTGVKDC